LLFLPFNCCATSFWDNLSGCLNNPCNCGLGTRYEQWNGQALNKGDQNTYCPPWNKQAGRDDHTCLANTPYPTKFTQWYLSHCAESTPESTYFNPRIRIRNQTCNAFSCWTLSKTLNWDGECVVWPSPYAFPLLRICARMAIAANSTTQTPDDPGYTRGKHLNYEGFEENDQVIIGIDSQPIPFDRPKLCAYRDPSALDVGISLDTITVPDLMDFNPVSQPIHKTTALHPLAKVIIFLIDTAAQTGQGLLQLIGTLFDTIGSKITPDNPNVNIFKPVFSSLGAIIEKFALLVKSLIQEVGQINRVVSDYKFGCVEIPLGPFPPPYCPVIPTFVPNATTQSICITGSNGLPVSSISSAPCVVSKVINNFIRNSIRVTFDNFVPLCRNGENPLTTDKCVTLSNVGLFNSASALHTATARRDAIRPCSTSSGSAPCVNTKIPFTCSIAANGCEDGFRVVYGTKIGQTSIPSNYFFDDLSDCGSSVHINCQEIWGINTGEFVDVSLIFPAAQTASNNGDLTQSFSLKDTNQATHSFTASIVRTSYFDSSKQLQRHPNQVCIFESNIVTGCQARADASKPVVYDCSAAISGLACTNDFFTPRFIASMQSGADSTSAVVEPLSVQAPNSTTYSVNLAGYNFTSFVTDNSFIQSPFTGSHSPNPSTIYGQYKSNAAPYDSNGNATNAVYLSGLEYINGKYNIGGNYACFQPQDLVRCPINEQKCVLTNLLNSNIINCNDFTTKSALYPNLRLCQSSDTSCTSIDSISGKSGGSGITIYRCGTDSTYCYKNSLNVAVCSISMNPADRVDPSSSLGTILSDSAWYHAGLSLQYDSSIYGLRDKTAAELGLCTSIPQPTCPAITTASSSTGNATWTQASIGQNSTGTCASGFSPPGTLTRTCLANSATKQVSLESITSSTTCSALPTYCAAVTVLPDGGYQRRYSFATWPQTPLGQVATGTCAPKLISGTMVAPVYSGTQYGNPLQLEFWFSNITQPQYAAWTGTVIYTTCAKNPVTGVPEFTQLDPAYYGCYIKSPFYPYTAMIVPGVQTYYTWTYYDYGP
jgi:hypothetical protein